MQEKIKDSVEEVIYWVSRIIDVFAELLELLYTAINCNNIQCVKSVRIQSYSVLHFPAFGLNKERYFLGSAELDLDINFLNLVFHLLVTVQKNQNSHQTWLSSRCRLFSWNSKFSKYQESRSKYLVFQIHCAKNLVFQTFWFKIPGLSSEIQGFPAFQKYCFACFFFITIFQKFCFVFCFLIIALENFVLFLVF